MKIMSHFKNIFHHRAGWMSCGIAVAFGLTLAACSDFDDYNEVPASAVAEADATLWGNISKHPQMTQFKALIERTGFEKELDGSRYYTVWAPLDNTYDVQSLSQLSDSALLRNFVKNHVAEYGKGTSGKGQMSVRALNNKAYEFVYNGDSAAYAGVRIAQLNQPSRNGIIHTLDGMAAYYDNIYDHLTLGKGFDSLATYVKRYELRRLNEKTSVEGPIVNGQLTYVFADSITENRLMSKILWADVENEDSSYTMFIPNDDAWNEAYARIKTNFHYVTKIVAKEFPQTTEESEPKDVTLDKFPADYTSDSLTRRQIVQYLIFSNNDTYNKLLTDPNHVEDAVVKDTLRTTLGRKLSDPDILLAHVTAAGAQKMSNGQVYVIDSLPFHSWQTYASVQRVFPYNYTTEIYKHYFISESDAQVYRRMEDKVSRIYYDRFYSDLNGLGYVHAVPLTGRKQPEMWLQLPEGLLSTKYNIYVVTFPPRYEEQLAEEEEGEKSNGLSFTLYYSKANGTMATEEFKNGNDEDQADGEKTYYFPAADQMDIIPVGQFTFPVCYAQTGYSPCLKIGQKRLSTNAKRKEFSRHLRIAAVLMVPAE